MFMKIWDYLERNFKVESISSSLNNGKIMYKYRIKIKKVSGKLDESVLTGETFIVKCNAELDDKTVFNLGVKYLMENYGLELESADVTQPQQIAVGYIVLRHMIEERPTRSAWSRGVKEYALEMVDHLEEYNDGAIPHTMENLNAWLLNGARDWKQASEGGLWLITDEEIAQRLCSPSELKKVAGGRRQPNKRETWIDVQARALFQASQIVKELGSQTVAFG